MRKLITGRNLLTGTAVALPALFLPAALPLTPSYAPTWQGPYLVR